MAKFLQIKNLDKVQNELSNEIIDRSRYFNEKSKIIKNYYQKFGKSDKLFNETKDKLKNYEEIYKNVQKLTKIIRTTSNILIIISHGKQDFDRNIGLMLKKLNE